MACDLVITKVTPHPPTSPGGFGYVEIAFTTSDQFVIIALSGPKSLASNIIQNGGVTYFSQLPAGGPYEYTISRQDDTSCQASGEFSIIDAPPAPDTSLSNAPRWEPVGGVLPNPVLLQVEATLLSAGAPRPGLHVEIELWRPAAVAAFASFRATVREAAQQVDAAPYLRAELRALQRYAAGLGAPFIDADASLRFTYRYRVVDKAGAEPWVKREGPRYAVLAALAGPADTMAPYVADSTGKVASVFDDYEGCQFVGYPLEASVLLPPASDTPRWAELRYLDAWGAAVEIRSYALASTLPAGMLRIPLPDDPPTCATAVEVSVRDDNRAFASTCGHVVPTPPTSTSGTYADSLYGLY